MRTQIRPISFTLQTILAFSILVVFTALAIGLPAAWLLKQQTEQHIDDLLLQGASTTQALLVNREADLKNLALLTAQRPTLASLLASENVQELHDYLLTLQSGAQVDIVSICRAQLPIAETAQFALACQLPDNSVSYRVHENRAWLLVSQPIQADVRVIVGYRLENTLLQTIQKESGLVLFLWQSETLLASSEPALENVLSNVPPNTSADKFFLNGNTFHSRLFPLPNDQLQLQLVLPVDSLLANQQRLTVWLIGLLGLVALVGSLAGVALSRRINQPLGQLYQAATLMRQGDLTHPLQINTRVAEVSQVAHALEETRSALAHSLSDLERQKEWSERLLSDIAEGILTLDAHGRITFFSSGAERITGWTQTQALGQTCDQLFPMSVGTQKFSQSLPMFGQTQKLVVQLRQQAVTLAISASQLAIPGMGAPQTVLVLRDVSEAEVLHQLLGDFIANIAHEFRTPLSALSASVELLNEQVTYLSPEEISELLTALHLGTLSLQTLIDNLLEGASIESGQFRVNTHPTDLPEIIHQVLTTLQPLFEKYRQQVEITLPNEIPPILADFRRSSQALLNLLANAIKWNPTPGKISILVTLIDPTPEANTFVRLAVRDEGPGLPKSQVDLFQRFARLTDGQSRTQVGAGLGLSVVKAIITAQGGTVGAENAPENGAIFWMTFPLLTPKK